MGTPTKAAFFAELTRLGVRYHDHTSGSTYLGSFTAKAITVHDSVTGGMTDETAVGFCKTGRSDVRGPLYGSLLGKDGVLHVLTLGRSNNTGSANGARCAMAQAGRMPLAGEMGSPPGDTYFSANTYHYGIAYITAGAGPYTTAQVAQMPKVLAAYGRAAGWSADGTAMSCIAHGEATNRKGDPQLDMGVIRRTTKAFHTAPPPPPPPPPPGDDIMTGITLAVLEKAIADNGMRVMQAYVLGETNLQTTGTELAYISDPTKQNGPLGRLNVAGQKMFPIIVLKSIEPEEAFSDLYAMGHGRLKHVLNPTALNGLRAVGAIAVSSADECSAEQFDAALVELKRWGFDVTCDCTSVTCRLDNGLEAPDARELPSTDDVEDFKLKRLAGVLGVDLTEDDEENLDPSGNAPA